GNRPPPASTSPSTSSPRCSCCSASGSSRSRCPAGAGAHAPPPPPQTQPPPRPSQAPRTPSGSTTTSPRSAADPRLHRVRSAHPEQPQGQRDRPPRRDRQCDPERLQLLGFGADHLAALVERRELPSELERVAGDP